MLRKVFSGRGLLLAAVILSSLVGTELYAKPKKSNLVKQEPGYYYGFGEGATNEDAMAKARHDLVVNSLTGTLRAADPEAATVKVSVDTVDERLGDIKVFNQSKNGLTVAYRMRISDWEKLEKSYQEKLRNNLSAAYKTLNSNANAGDRLTQAQVILSTLAQTGEFDLLTMQDKGTELYSKKVESIVSGIIKNISITSSVKNGFVDTTKTITVKVADKNGSPVSGLKLKAVWSNPYFEIALDSELAEVISMITTDAQGNADVDLPVDEEYKNKFLCLSVSTTLSSDDYATSSMRRMDGDSAIEARYFYCDDVNEAFKSVTFEAGKFNAGAVEHDTRATSKEKKREVKLGKYSIDVAPVTNYQYAGYLFVNGIEEVPEYFNHEDYNNEKQPVIGITAEQAEAYAAWLSEQTGSKYRLPSDDEWEQAARAGKETIYTWGDDNPSKEKKANYKGNGKYSSPSPVGAFPDSNNDAGLVDMCGNVWEWTNTARNTSDPDARTVKGGSWMDGPIDLRISNFKNIKKDDVYPDVGFRLIKEEK